MHVYSVCALSACVAATAISAAVLCIYGDMKYIFQLLHVLRAPRALCPELPVLEALPAASWKQATLDLSLRRPRILFTLQPSPVRGHCKGVDTRPHIPPSPPSPLATLLFLSLKQKHLWGNLMYIFVFLSCELSFRIYWHCARNFRYWRYFRLHCGSRLLWIRHCDDYGSFLHYNHRWYT